ncbi:deoxyribodipyrimidine photo-lyase [candidate division KSB1 bacterium]|nr:deoxyribodipyrimidine photo-lyase [candidate division KSB1 bacterium]
MSRQKIVFFWFRRDLRYHDNAGLFHALSSGHPVLPLYIFDSNILNKLPRFDPRAIFIHRSLHELSKKHSGILVKYGEPIKIWQQLVKEYRPEAVYFNRDYEPAAVLRDNKIKAFLKSYNIPVYDFKDQVIFEKQEICKNDGAPYTVYTPYKNKWLEILHRNTMPHFTSEKLMDRFLSFHSPTMPTLEEMNFENKNFPFPEKEIPRDIIQSYHKTRDYPAIHGTSRLGLHIRFGTLSIRELVQAGLMYNETWLSELIWREFFISILAAFPHVVDTSFRHKYDQIPWLNNPKDLKRWCNGETGYPIVDAGMRELNVTGFMHNRVRMITASFLTKHLLIDWRWGERYFAEKLLDYDLAANNGNWQWAAGTGCDAAPYFRIFNPERQTARFDPDEEYIQKWVPERNRANYSPPIVEHSFARQRALETYKKALLNS